MLGCAKYTMEFGFADAITTVRLARRAQAEKNHY